jgi:hypothetical protein
MINMYMKISQGYSLCSYLKETKRSFLFLFSFTNIREQEGRRGPECGGQWEGGQ